MTSVASILLISGTVAMKRRDSAFDLSSHSMQEARSVFSHEKPKPRLICSARSRSTRSRWLPVM